MFPSSNQYQLLIYTNWWLKEATNIEMEAFSRTGARKKKSCVGNHLRNLLSP